jgi:sialidase-1
MILVHAEAERNSKSAALISEGRNSKLNENEMWRKPSSVRGRGCLGEGLGTERLRFGGAWCGTGGLAPFRYDFGNIITGQLSTNKNWIRNMKMKRNTFAILWVLAVCGAVFATEPDWDADLKPFLGEPKIEKQQVFSGDRFPNVVVAKDGSVLAVWNGVKVRRSEDGGATWGPEITIAKGFMGGGVTVNETNGDIFAFVSEAHPPSTEKIYRSQDHGKTWSVMDAVIKPDSKGYKPEMHMNEHGITLMRGAHKGRLIRPSRFYGKANDKSEWPNHYTNAIYSDDGGTTWLTSDPFPANGTGEATIAELSDGRIYYNSRRHWVPEGEDNSTRWTAMSDDGGATWKDMVMCKDLPDGPRDTGYGLMGGLVRLPVKDKDILIFSNVESPAGRHHGTVWASFDGGKTWPLKRLVNEGAFAYSSLNVGRPGTKSEGWIYLLSEGAGGEMWRFNLSWLLAGEKTGSGEVPKWVTLITPE